MTTPGRGLLADITVLDLATPWGEYAGRLLADLGAMVFKLEPPEGAAARSLPPFDTRPGREGRSLYWEAAAAGKQAFVADPATSNGAARIRELVRGADVLVESFAPGTMDAWGLGYDALSKLNPGIVYVSVTPYGQDGPKAAWPATELTVEASSGRMARQGDGDRPPIPIGFPQSAFHAGAQAAADAIIALNERERSGLGQHLDVSAQAAMVWTLMDATGYPALTGGDPPGAGDDRKAASDRPGFTSATPCGDGWVVATLQPQALGRGMPGAIAALSGTPFAVDELASVDWSEFEERVLNGGVRQEALLAVYQVTQAYLSRATRGAIQAWAAESDVRVAPVNDAAELLASPQLKARGFWVERGGTTAPGYPARLSRGQPGTAAAPGPATAPPPSVPARAAPPVDGPRDGEAFAGLKVLDLTWVAAGPLTAKALADHGATVVKVESGTRMDLVRALPPFKDNIPGPNRSQWQGNTSSSKRSLTLNLATEQGRALARRLALEWADVVMDSFTPGTMARLGLDSESLRAARPDLITFSTCLMGQTGPYATYGGFGNHGAAISGITHLTGWPGRPPAGPYGPYTDIITPRFAVATVAAAVLERRRTGMGVAIDLSQVECGVRFIEPVLLDAAANGHIAGPSGIESARSSPHGVYQTLGTERFIAVEVEHARQWRALCGVIGAPGWTDGSLDTVDARRAIAGEIDARIAAWAAGRTAFEAERAMVTAGVPAAAIRRATDLHRDPQLAHRGFFVPFDHPEIGRVPYDGFATRFSAKAVSLHTRAPLLGEHTVEVLTEIFGMAEDEVAELAALDVFS
ncbi:MAG: CoA transferase [Dehalococcoidia bacterium]|nr:CoA transferase [Dehalococcoidia bacterium]